MPKILEQVIVNIGRDRRITLPSFMKLEAGQQLLMQELEDGSYILKPQSNAPKIKVYAVEVGKAPNGYYYGIFLDVNGNILARKRSSTQEYLKKDLTILDKVGRDKLDKMCGLGCWELPTLVEANEYLDLPPKAYKTFYNIRQELEKGTWPPRD